MREENYHIVMCGLKLNKDLEFVILSLNPKWEGATDRKNVHWLKSDIDSYSLDSDKDYERARIATNNPELLMGYVFPDGSIDRNLLETGILKDPLNANPAELSYLHYGEDNYIGIVLLCHKLGWGQSSNLDVLLEALRERDNVVKMINTYGFGIIAEDLKIHQMTEYRCYQDQQK